MKHALVRTLVGVALCALAVAPASAGPLAVLHAGPVDIEWQPALADTGLVLVVSGPEGFQLRQQFAAGVAPSFSAFDEEGNLRPAGVYVWELRAVRELGEDVKRELEAARLGGDESTLRKAGKLSSDSAYESGSFSILEGKLVAGGLEEPARAGAEAQGNRLAEKTTISGDLTVYNSLCVGFDCPASPVYSDSTILMMENNTRIKFGDTSNSPFPNNDWEIEANSSASGGQSYLGFNDCGTADNDGGCTTDLVFAVEAGARQNALYVESDGDVGMGTSNPAVNIHVVDGNTPTLRLEQDGSSGFAPQIWDVAGNETNFFIRDVTNGSTLPFRIFPGAASSSLVIDDTDNVGIGTVSPASALHVLRTGTGVQELLELEASGTNGRPRFTFSNPSGTWFYEANGDNFEINRSGSGAPEELLLEPNGDLTIGGMLTELSSRAAKEGFVELDPVDVLSRVVDLPVLSWSYTADRQGARHVGPMAEDFYQAFELGDDDRHIAPGDKAGVALLAIQGLTRVVGEKDREIESLRSEVDELKRLVRELSER